MKIQLFRVDDRLIHGQVVIGWASHLKSEQIILCDDSVYNNDWEKELYLSVVDESIKTQVLSVAELAGLFKEGIVDLSKTIIVVKGPEVVEELLEKNVVPDIINIGGLHYKEGRETYLSYLYLGPEEVASFKRIMNSGVRLVCQDVPEAKEVPFQDIIV